MSSTISLAAFTDSAFVLLVMLACGRALQAGRSSGISSRWKQELTTLESSLRDIVSEATISSGTLDKQLLRRQEDLELLLRRIEKAQISFEESRSRTSALSLETPERISVIDRRPEKSPTVPVETISAGHQFDEDEDLPNPTWSSRSLRSNDAQSRQTATSTNQTPLRQQIEFVKPNDQSREDRELLRSIDPAAMRVAERLLDGGQEIHVVARKLELSVAQVRAIDVQRHPERSAEAAPVEAAPTTTAPKSTATQNRRQSSPLFQDDIPWTIDRETALL